MSDYFIPDFYVRDIIETINTPPPGFMRAQFKPLTPEQEAELKVRNDDYDRRRALALEIFPELENIERQAEDW